MEWWVVLLINLAISAVVYFASPKPPNNDPQPGRLDVPQPKMGSPIPVVFGEDWVEDAHIAYYGNATTEAIKKKGGKK